MICKNCNTNLKDNDKFCFKCGNKIEPIINDTNNIEKDTNETVKNISETSKDINKTLVGEYVQQPIEPNPHIKNNREFKSTNDKISEFFNKSASWLKSKSQIVVQKIKSLTKKQKLIIVSLLAVCIIGGAYTSMPQNPNKLVNKFETAVINNDVKKLKNIVSSDDKRLSITEDNLNAILEFYKNNPSSLNNDIEYLKSNIDSMKYNKEINYNENATYNDSMPFNIVKKKVLFRDKYYINLSPRYVQLDSAYENVKINLSNGKSIVQEDLKEGEIGPFLPGQYDLVITSDIEFAKFEKHQTISLFYEDTVSEITVDANINNTTIDSDEADAIIYIDGKSTKKTAKEIKSIPGLNNGSTIYGVFNYNGKEIKSNVETVDGESTVHLTYEYTKPPTSEDVEQSIHELMSNYLPNFSYAVNQNDLSYIEQYLYRGSSLYNEQKDTLPEFNAKGITESYIEHEILNVDYNEDKKEGTVLVREVFELTRDGNTNRKSFKNKYYFIYNEDTKSYELTDLDVNI